MTAEQTSRNGVTRSCGAPGENLFAPRRCPIGGPRDVRGRPSVDDVIGEQTGRRRYVLEAPLLVVPVDAAAVKAGEVDIGPTVAIEVANRAAMRIVAAAPTPRSGGDCGDVRKQGDIPVCVCPEITLRTGKIAAKTHGSPTPPATEDGIDRDRTPSQPLPPPQFSFKVAVCSHCSSSAVPTRKRHMG